MISYKYSTADYHPKYPWLQLKPYIVECNGVCIEIDGEKYVLTCNHCARNANYPYVVFSDKTIGEFIFYMVEFDLAILKLLDVVVNPQLYATPVKISDKMPQPGDSLHCMGDKFVVKDYGIATYKTAQIRYVCFFIETDTLEPGSPVYNKQNQLVGIVQDYTDIKSMVAVLPLVIIQQFLYHFKNKLNSVKRIDLNYEINDKGQPIIVNTFNNGPAIQNGDIITAVDKYKVNSRGNLNIAQVFNFVNSKGDISINMFFSSVIDYNETSTTISVLRHNTPINAIKVPLTQHMRHFYREPMSIKAYCVFVGIVFKPLNIMDIMTNEYIYNATKNIDFSHIQRDTRLVFITDILDTDVTRLSFDKTSPILHCINDEPMYSLRDVHLALTCATCDPQWVFTFYNSKHKIIVTKKMYDMYHIHILHEHSIDSEYVSTSDQLFKI